MELRSQGAQPGPERALKQFQVQFMGSFWFLSSGNDLSNSPAFVPVQ